MTICTCACMRVCNESEENRKEKKKKKIIIYRLKYEKLRAKRGDRTVNRHAIANGCIICFARTTLVHRTKRCTVSAGRIASLKCICRYAAVVRPFSSQMARVRTHCVCCLCVLFVVRFSIWHLRVASTTKFALRALTS